MFVEPWNTCSEAEPTPGHGDFQCASNSCKLKYDYARRPFVSAKKVSVVRRNPWLLEHVVGKSGKQVFGKHKGCA